MHTPAAWHAARACARCKEKTAATEGSRRSFQAVALAMTAAMQRDDLLAVRDRRRAAVCRPLLHEPAALLQQVASGIGLISLVAKRVAQRDFENFARGAGALAAPIAEARPKAVDGCAAAAMTEQRL